MASVAATEAAERLRTHVAAKSMQNVWRRYSSQKQLVGVAVRPPPSSTLEDMTDATGAAASIVHATVGQEGEHPDAATRSFAVPQDWAPSKHALVRLRRRRTANGSGLAPLGRSSLFLSAALPPNVGLPPKSAKIGQPERNPLELRAVTQDVVGGCPRHSGGGQS